MLFRFLILIHVCAAFPLKCPEPAQWSLRARGHCPDPSKYFCLRNDLINGYSENCTVYDFLQPGRKNVLRGGLDADVCSSERYQPWPITFYTNVSTNCIFLKSTCNEEGQVVYDEGNRNTDFTCRCDYTNGYDFLIHPRNPCYCVPSEEDCSCYLKTCHDSTFKLSPDYECVDSRMIMSISQCRSIMNGSDNKDAKQSQTQLISIKDNIAAPVLWKMFAWISTFVACIVFIGLIFVLCGNGLFDKYYRKAYLICKPPESLTLIEGQTVNLTYKLLINRFVVVFKRNDVVIGREIHTNEKDTGRSKTLPIEHITLNDEGEYYLEAPGLKCRPTIVTVKPLFKRPLEPLTSVEGLDVQFECETEEDDSSSVQWFKDNIPIKFGTGNLKMESLPGHIHKLIISPASLQDSGIYRIEKNGIRSEAGLNVKALFKRPLTTETVMEGLNVLFECETEEDNSSVQWFKDNIPITFGTGNLKMETLPGHIHKLIISPASLQDSGRYRIEKNGIRSEAVLHVKEMPETIKQMSDHNREEFLKATKSGTSKRYNVRVMIVGKGQVGKTCLLRRLMKEQIDDVKSTDGLDILRSKCQINVDNGEWDLSTRGKDPYCIWSGQNEQFADCGFWDFAGQKEFYATHQTFLSSSAVYLLVVDISEEFKEKTSNRMIEESYDSIGEYIEFWLDNIHCYSTEVNDGSIQYNTNRDLNPPVIIVCTGIDKIQSAAIEERKQKFHDYLGETLFLSEKRRHLREVHILSNEIASDYGEEFERLRKDIFDKARTLKNWGDNLPTRWLVLEKEIYTKISVGIYTLSYNEAIQIAMDCSFPNLKQTTSELDSFLKYEHDIGNIIFFEDVKDFIVLDPKWLVDVFKCFVSHQYKRALINMPEWSELEKNGKLLDNLIVRLLEKVPHLTLKKHKDFVLKIMEKFDIIVRPINDPNTDVVYMPCKTEAVKIDKIIEDIGAKDWKKTSWFYLEFDFLPPSYFNHILACFVKEMKLWAKKDNQLCIYRNIGLFEINEVLTKVLIVCLSTNSIGMQVRQWKGEDCYSNIKDKLIDLVHSMKLRYRMNILYKKKFKCSNGIYYTTEGRVDYETLLCSSEYNCLEHAMIHSTKEIYRSWITEEEVEDELEKKGFRRCNYCKNMSVYKCYDCNKALCKDCSRKHDISHAMQLISDTFIMNCKGQTEQYVRDVECLPNGEIIVASWLNQQIFLFSVSGRQRIVLQLESKPCQIVVVDKTTVAVFVLPNDLAIVDIQQNHVQYIRNNAIPNSSNTLIYIENELYIGYEYGIVVFDMSGKEKRRIKLSFTPYDMCNDCDSQHIYCIDSTHSQLICIDRDGNDIFTFTDPSMTNLKCLTTDNDGNVLVLCGTEDDNSRYSVIKVDSNGEKSEVVITNMNRLYYNDPRICYDHLTNSVVIGLDNKVHIYKKN